MCTAAVSSCTASALRARCRSNVVGRGGLACVTVRCLGGLAGNQQCTVTVVRPESKPGGDGDRFSSSSPSPEPSPSMSCCSIAPGDALTTLTRYAGPLVDGSSFS